ncbi:hypothetical protein PTSG_04921 [Salpingoeca rosetta]|uniref:PDZ domain-containing protein n=1 Tax=Salpingoeca rosetta (strain ATCC 50818 / BSB-021) TaxID=946362 RepID=F2U904_SALR5|nr:uncharacterized protein PTSG_04921 [Salpingoeca rosetta]EGD73207.1 hypothetical protein PTSG_04921 [Salpingoeca rosetta]|eukprot:XP_004994238.1 hypothetical protein PTSG_04921 [Salpingoeca rosetta]
MAEAPARDVEITKGPKGYGFNLALMGGVHFFRVIEPDGPAHKAGVNPGDRILKVNGQDVRHASHSALVTLMKQAGTVLRLQVQALSKDQLQTLSKPPPDEQSVSKMKQDMQREQRQQTQLMQQQQQQQQQHQQQQQQQQGRMSKQISSSSLKEGQVRLMLVRTDKGFGFNLSKAGDKHFFRVVQPGGAAAKAGAHPGDEIVAINGKSIAGMQHSDVVQLIKDAGEAVEIVVVPQKGRASMAASDSTFKQISQAQERAKEVIQADAERVRQAKADAEKARKASLVEADELRELRRREQFEHDRKIIEENLAEAKKDAETLRARMKTARESAQKVGTPLELKNMQDILNGIREREFSRLKEQQSEDLPSDEYDRQVEELRREMQKAVIEQEIFAVQAAEWSKFAVDCEQRRKEEERLAKDEFERTKAARERDLEFLRQKEERMKRLMEEAEQQRQKEIEEAAAKRRQQEDKLRKEAEARAAKAEAAAQARKEQQKLFEEREERQRKMEEEARQLREQQQREEQERRQKLQQRLDEEEEANRDRFGVMLKRRVPEPKGNPSHPMIGHLAQRKGAANLLHIPLSNGMKDTAM